jgi:hypothetical protein
MGREGGEMTKTDTQFDTTLSRAIIDKITEAIQFELLKRGFHVKILIGQSFDRFGKLKLVLDSDVFQTTPVLFKELRIQSFGSASEIHDDLTADIWFGVHAFWRSFDGGQNGTKLFDFRCQADIEHDEISIR